MQARFAWEDGNGNVCVTTCADGVDPIQEEAVLRSTGQIPKQSVAVHNPVFPDPSQRGKWRLVGSQIVVDPTVPDPPADPQQKLRDQLEQAATLDALKDVIAQVIQ